MGSLREVIKEKSVTLHPPAASLYSTALAFRFPEVTATSLAGEEVSVGPAAGGLFENRWTLLGCAGSNFAKSMVDTWMEAAAAPELVASAAEAGRVGLQTSWLSLVEGTLLSWLRRPLLLSMRSSVPAERHTRFLCTFGQMEQVRRTLQMQNKYLGYVCLVDPQGIVRWHVHGNEVPSDTQVRDLCLLYTSPSPRDS